ncbi:CLUMA_CG002770, isoform A [Clunio marinus]|uniref:CLUMA_CG002770, isoform A n=1 Tax=Clunio marinus TaxID=568069 RepID=A0A1J1HR95_9DIPT|nr:CLUMA_CG002770, isoform A [Clunio marinus]
MSDQVFATSKTIQSNKLDGILLKTLEFSSAVIKLISKKNGKKIVQHFILSHFCQHQVQE